MNLSVPARPARLALTTTVLIALAACGGGFQSPSPPAAAADIGPAVRDTPVAPVGVKHSTGVTLAGLSDGELVLRNNAADDLTLEANGDFSFPLSLDEGAGYAVNVRAHPRWQFCDVARATGKAGAGVRVAVNCAAHASVGVLPTDEAFFDANAVAVDGGGNVYVSDEFHHRIHKIGPAGQVTVLAGSGKSGALDATGTGASFRYPTGIAVDAAGTVYVADTGNHTIRKITPQGVVTTLAGTVAKSGALDGKGGAASFRSPFGVAVNLADGRVYVADTYNHLIRKISPQGKVETLAGSVGRKGALDGKGDAARFDLPTGVAVGADGHLYVADTSNHLIRKITPQGEVSTLAGTAGVRGAVNGRGSTASFHFPAGIAADADGQVYVADQDNHLIRRIAPSGAVTKLAGMTGARGAADGPGRTALFSRPAGVAVDAGGRVHVVDLGNNRIRTIEWKAPAPP